MVCDKVVVGGGGQTEEEEEEEARDTESKTRTPHKVVGNKKQQSITARSKRTSRFHKSHLFIQKFTGKMPQTNKMSSERRGTFCESLRSRNACQDFTRANLCENNRQNAVGQREHPDQAPAFTPTVKRPQCGHTVWGTIDFNAEIEEDM